LVDKDGSPLLNSPANSGTTSDKCCWSNWMRIIAPA
jgi:hypothetical protein